MNRENSLNESNKHSLSRRDALKGMAAVSLGVATGVSLNRTVTVLLF